MYGAVGPYRVVGGIFGLGSGVAGWEFRGSGVQGLKGPYRDLTSPGPHPSTPRKDGDCIVKVGLSLGFGVRALGS